MNWIVPPEISICKCKTCRTRKWEFKFKWKEEYSSCFVYSQYILAPWVLFPIPHHRLQGTLNIFTFQFLVSKEANLSNNLLIKLRTKNCWSFIYVQLWELGGCCSEQTETEIRFRYSVVNCQMFLHCWSLHYISPKADGVKKNACYCVFLSQGA